jgi:hypothetical protein
VSRQKEKYHCCFFLRQLSDRHRQTRSEPISRPTGSNQEEREVVLLKIGSYLDLWEISKLSSGMYIFRIKVKDLDGKEHEVEGKVVVVR